GLVRDVEYLERVGRSRALHYVSEAVPDPDSVAAARVNAARVGKVGLACQTRGRRVGYVEDLEGVGRSRALDNVGVVARDEYAVARVIGQVGLADEYWRGRVSNVEYLEGINRAASLDDISEAVLNPYVVRRDPVAAVG